MNAVDRPRDEAGLSVGRIFRNAGALLSGKAFGGALSLAYLAIAARTLGASDMGYLVLANAYAMAVAGIVRFQSWQAVIRFGAPMIEAGEEERFRGLLRYTVKLDAASAVAGVAVAVLFVGPVASVLHWPPKALPWIYVYCCAVPFLIAATPTGVLRLFDRFAVLGWQLSITPVVRFAGAIILWLAGGGLVGFIVVWILGGVMDGATLWWLGWRELKKRQLTPALFERPAAKAPRSWLSFMLKTNLASTFDLARNNLPLLIVGAGIGSAASGLLQLATNLTNLIAHPANMLYHATFPELTKVAASQGRSAMGAVALRSIGAGFLAAAPFVIAYVLFRREIVTLVGGPEFAAAAPILALMAFAQFFRTTSIVLEAGSLAMGYAGVVLIAQGLSAAAQLAALGLLMAELGAAAAPAALMVGLAVMIGAHVWRWLIAGAVGGASGQTTSDERGDGIG